MLLFFLFHGVLVDFAYSKISQLSRFDSLSAKSKLAPFWETFQDDGEFDKWISFSSEELSLYKEKARAMFYHGYENYMSHAFPLDELDPIGCAGRGPDLQKPENININDVLGNYSLTLIDSMDTLALLGDKESFRSAVDFVVESVDFNQPYSVNVFEVTIRVLGALLSSHSLIVDPEQMIPDLHPEYNGGLLGKAVDLADRIIPSFETSSGVPLPRIKLNGGPAHTSNRTDTTIASATSLILEFGLLSKLTGNDTYLSLARNAVDVIWGVRNETTGLWPSGIDSRTLLPTNNFSGFGAGFDSFPEYLLKSYIMFGYEVEFSRFTELIRSYRKYARQGRPKCFSGDGTVPFFTNVNYSTGEIANTWLDSLSAFLPGLLTLSGDVEEAVCLHFLYFTIWRMFDAFPERFDWNKLSSIVHFYPLRPELIESTYHLYRVTKSPFYLHVGKELLNSIERNMKTECGFATLHSVLDRTLEDRMESFFLAETVKYLYLLFDAENPLHKSEKWIFSTEGHVLPVLKSEEKVGSKCTSPGLNLTRTPENTICPGVCHQFTRQQNLLPLQPKYIRQIEAAIGLRHL
ncbi:Oidioi.mRNA.OKI2018_I69.XSR.g16895.t1.cds [Oikopleura dioica]|uniref:alpha-1,2-Mannosidase n=1 Tax=Oikopleura dioica TaxID=34765 RepID=A0ABN7SMN6_OIKDI|nr:Oidioi.mRNA.OKI2018_I69.XSR.g16895.t1.cds [Oikopleura dioica]